MRRPAWVCVGMGLVLAVWGCSDATSDGAAVNTTQGQGGQNDQQTATGGVAPGAAAAGGTAVAGSGGTSSGGSTTLTPAGGAGGALSVAGGGAGGGAQITAGSGGGDTAGAANVGGGGAGGDSGLYPPPPRDMVIDTTRGNMTIGVSVTDADPTAQAYHGGDQPAQFDAGAAVVRKKLVIGLHGIGNGPGPGGALGWAAQRGFHTLALDYYNTESGPNGSGYLEIWSGEDFSPDFEVPPVNSVRNRVKTALAWLATQDPGADWGYYLNQDGSVRWSDVIAFGYSFGGQTAAAATKLDALDRAIATSAPGLSTDSPIMAMPAITPGERGWALFDESDNGDNRKSNAATALGWPGMPVDTTTVAAPYMDSHILLLNGGGHSEFCSRSEFDTACEVAFGIYAGP